MLACSDLHKAFGNRRVLQGCSVEIPPGQCIVLRGRSGSGKTTLLRCLALLERPDRGSIRRAETVFSYPDAGPTRQQEHATYPFSTVVFQQLHLWPNLTVRQNIALVTSHDLHAPLPEVAEELLRRLSVHEVIDLRPGQCSLGQRQRVAIARALASKASFVLMDEPTSALDRANRRVVVDVLREARDAGRGFLIISHDEREFTPVTDKLLELDEGVVDEVGPQ